MRLNYTELASEATRSLYKLSGAIAKSGLDPALRELVAVYVSTRNRCAHCIAVHWEKALKVEVPERLLRVVSAYQGEPSFTPLQVAALDLAERITREPHLGVPEELVQRVRAHLEDDIVTMHLIYHIILMNAWNRLSITIALEPPGPHLTGLFEDGDVGLDVQ